MDLGIRCSYTNNNNTIITVFLSSRANSRHGRVLRVSEIILFSICFIVHSSIIRQCFLFVLVFIYAVTLAIVCIVSLIMINARFWCWMVHYKTQQGCNIPRNFPIFLTAAHANKWPPYKKKTAHFLWIMKLWQKHWKADYEFVFDSFFTHLPHTCIWLVKPKWLRKPPATDQKKKCANHWNENAKEMQNKRTS